MQKLNNKFNNLLRKIIKQIFQTVRWVNHHKNLSKAINWILAAILLIYLHFSLRSDIQLIINSLSISNPLNVGFSTLLYGINFYIFYGIWQILFTAFGFSIGKTKSLRIFSITYLAKFIPSPIFFYFSRITQLEKLGVNSINSISITALEFLFQILTGVGILGIISVQLSEPITLLWLLGLIPIIVLCLKPSLLNLQNYFEKSSEFKFNLIYVIKIIFLGTIPWILGGLFFLYILKIFSSEPLVIDYLYILKIWILSNLASMIGSYLLGGLGLLREFTLVILLQNYYPSSLAILISATVRIVLVLSGIIWAAFFYLITVIIEWKMDKIN